MLWFPKTTEDWRRCPKTEILLRVSLNISARTTEDVRRLPKISKKKSENFRLYFCRYIHMVKTYVLQCTDLTNRLWFRVVSTLTYNDMLHHSGQNVVDSRGEAQYPQYPRPRKCFFRAWPSSRHKERARVVYYFLAIWLVYSPKWAFLIGYYNKTQLPQEFGIEQSDRKVERLFTKIQFYCSVTANIQAEI